MPINVTVGPRALRKQQRFLEEAKQERSEEQENELNNEQEDSVYESTSAAANKFVKCERSVMETCDRQDEDAITFWSSTKKRGYEKKCKRPLFGKVSSFTNDIKDGRFFYDNNS